MTVPLHEAFEKVQSELRKSSELVTMNLVQTESEQILQEAFRRFHGRVLSRLKLFSSFGAREPRREGEWISRLALEWASEVAVQRVSGHPLQHLLGFQTFLDHEYEVGPEVLIPRPETELLVLTVIAALEQTSGAALGFEIGLGSGAISIELLAKFSSLRMVASELSDAAIGVAQKNVTRILGAGALGTRLQILKERDALAVGEALVGQHADFLVSNPPYLTRGDAIERQVLDNEPSEALFAPEGKPLYFYEEILRLAPVLLKPGASVYLELAAERAQEISQLFVAPGWQVTVHRDLNGLERVLEARIWIK
ncbi:HemK family protein methyltransferase [Bdellovibrionota bacterium FG-2]